ncbi:MAG: germination protein YpeB [Clostridiales bacterium]|nr:germination protein YpeB [Clostridiales bacterium]
MTRKNTVRLISFTVAFCVVTLGFAIAGWRQATLYQRYLEYGNQRAFSNLVTSISNLDSALQKGVYANSPSMISSLAAQIWRESSNAKANLSQMPLSNINLDQTQKFISQVGEYGYTVLRKASSGELLSDEDRKIIRSLSKTADKLAMELEEVKTKYDAGSLKLGQNQTQKTFSAKAADSTSDGGFDGIEKNFPEYAALIYDGPYSDHIEKMEPVFIKGKPDITEAEAKKKAANFLKTEPDKIKSSGSSNGKIKTYTFYLESKEGEISVEITKAGGYILQATDSRAGGEKKISAEDAVKRAASILNSLGFPNMKESYHTEYDNVVTVNFAATVKNVICYPDLIKVSVSLNDGSLRSIDAYGYIMNHKERNLPAPTVSMDVASKNVNNGLKILSKSLAVIPTNGLNEVFCYEFKCADATKRHFIIYVNAKTGSEENILILIENENGTLAM